MRGRFRHLAAATTVMTLVLILVGVYTGAKGYGLECAGRWPFCDGYLGMLPAHWPSFVEWFHRLLAMLVGFMILGTAAVAWRGDYDPRITWAAVIALVVTPIQVLLGANTVLNFGVWSQVLHHGAAQVIFGGLVVATTLAYVQAGGGGNAGDAPLDGDSEAASLADD